ncbi:hypothetical protein BK128_04685 [Viridibacillus sp. FSL H7-0596]|uniref:DNA primase family protein n=1 Tax=Viridibacillus sp. FSL H7-0596 TaxID=1928923 RepID=UPI00096D04C5|nr:phage/plasmid primase, P4 family [Viridibacillus sp. FSL H7-0596]OMC89223.1 hypothetical protein BK128_04685 [Viridibacillus sp. FSL H7-0596]
MATIVEKNEIIRPSSQIVNIADFIHPDSIDNIHHFLIQTPFFKWCLENPTKLTEQLLIAVAKFLYELDEVEEYETALLDVLDEEQNLIYQKVKSDFLSNIETTNSVYDYNFLQALKYQKANSEQQSETPTMYVNRIRKDYQLEVRGITKNERNTASLEANQFASYVLTRIPIIQTKKNIIYFYNGKGKYIPLEQNVFKSICSYILKEAESNLWKHSWEREYLAALNNTVPIVQKFDNDSNIINLKNGYLKIDTMTLVEHNPHYFSVNQLPYSYEPQAICPNFENFLTDVFKEDKERIQLIQQILGYCFYKEVLIHKAFIFLGAGSNGKSVLAKVMSELLGKQNISSTPLADFETKFGFQDMEGKLVNIASENELGTNFNTQNLKNITGGDTIQIERKHETAYSTVLYTKVVLLMNKLMYSNDHTEGYYRRLQIIPFNKTYVELKKGQKRQTGVSYMDPFLLDKLLAELPGIFNFALEGLINLQKNNFRLADSSICNQALKRYKSKQNPMKMFFDECIQYEEDSKIRQSEVSKEYKNWLRNNSISTDFNHSNNAILEAFRNEIEQRGWVVNIVKQSTTVIKNLGFK